METKRWKTRPRRVSRLLKLVRLSATVLSVWTLSAASRSAQATDFNWRGPENGFFTDPLKWSPTGVPGGADTAIFNHGPGVAYTVTFPGGSVLDPPPSYVINYLRVHSNEVTFRDNSSPFVTSPSLTVANPDDSIVVGQDTGEVAVLHTSLSSFSGAEASIGQTAGASGTVNVNSGTFHVTRAGFAFMIGLQGEGVLNVNNGARVNAKGTPTAPAQTTLGWAPGSIGTATITGAGSTLDGDQLWVGAFGEGTLTVQNGGSLLSSSAFLGNGEIHPFESAGRGEVIVRGAGSTWINTFALSIGHVGQMSMGTLRIEDGGSVGLFTPHVTPVEIGNSSESTGTTIVTGTGSTWTMSRPLRVGYQGAGTLRIESGGKVSNTTGQIAWAPGSTGTATIMGTGSAWTLSERLLVSGDLSLGNGGEGTLTIGQGGTVTVAQEIYLFPDALVRLQGGTLDAPAIVFQGGGVFVWTGGTLHVDQFASTLFNEGGTLSPGRPVGITKVVGAYIVSPDPEAVLEIEIGGSSPGAEHDVVNISGSTLLSGQLSLALVDNFMPAAEASFTVLSAGSLSGAFSNVANGQRLITLDGRGSFQVNYGPGSPFNQNQIVLTAFEAVLIPGDFDLDFDVDGDDFETFKTCAAGPALSYASGCTLTPDESGHVAADFDQDGDVDGKDFAVFQRCISGTNVPADPACAS